MFRIDGRSSKPIYIQIIESVKEKILKGILRPGDKMPSVREMAKMISTNPNTVSKAYKELEREKVIETIMGRGTFVANNYKPKIDEDKLNSIKEKLKNIVIEGYYIGVHKEEIINMLDKLYEEIINKE